MFPKLAASQRGLVISRTINRPLPAPTLVAAACCWPTAPMANSSAAPSASTTESQGMPDTTLAEVTDRVALSVTISGLDRLFGDDLGAVVDIARMADDLGVDQLVLPDHVAIGPRLDRYP